MKRLPSIVLGISGLVAMLFGFQHPETTAITAGVFLQIAAVVSLLVIGSAESATIEALRLEIKSFDKRIADLASTLRSGIDLDNERHNRNIEALKKDAAQTRDMLNTVVSNHPTLLRDPLDMGFSTNPTQFRTDRK